MGKIYTKCGGGLGNRILGFITAYYFANICNKKLIVHWPVDNPACMVGWYDLFKEIDGISFISTELDVEEHDSSSVWLVHNPAFFINMIEVHHHRGMQHIEIADMITTNSQENKNVFIQDDNIHNTVPYDFVMNVFKNIIKPIDNILDKVNTFCNENDINKDTTLGCHLRMTDASTGPRGTPETTIRNIKEWLENSDYKKVFICSDDEETEKFIYKTLPSNIILNKKSEYVKKYDVNESWEERSYNKFPCGFNVLRDKQSVIEAVEDCWILSKTYFTLYSGGSFAKLARLKAESREYFNEKT
tara:strand:+ start:144 stop:1049 length:906 start_codon:yes stop_codon:yes gene_type:complete